ncbi:MAG: glucose-6-phosphate isomerase [Alphaproteobacteria bacterium]|nr:glucose-6-phosphate isomerase [Alphaproteobacteria bacterium]
MTAYRQLTTHCPPPSAETLARLEAPLASLKHPHNSTAPLLRSWQAQGELPPLQALADELRQRFDHVIIVGAGGSGLSGRVLSCLRPSLAPQLHFLENIDPDAIGDLLQRVVLEKSVFIFISKSGATVETLAHFHAITAVLAQQLGSARIPHHGLAITMAGDNPLRRAATHLNMRCLDHPADIGGRFSLFTAVGLLPAAIAGIDLPALLGGAASVGTQLMQVQSPGEFAPALGAAMQYDALKQGRSISVMLPYAQRLEGFSSWYRQSWAESLGKSGRGTTPIRAVGSTDQHSQLQLYLDGPKDKFFTMILLDRLGTGQPIGTLADPALAFISGRTTGDVLAAQQQATLTSLANSGAPVRVMQLAALNESSLGGLLAHFTLEIILMAALLEVNPFDQPAVEEGKQLARDYLLRPAP